MIKKLLSIAVLALLATAAVDAQNIKIKGVYNNARYDDSDRPESTYLGWNAELGKAIFEVDNGIYSMTWNGTTLSEPAKEPAIDRTDVMSSNEKQLWCTNFNLMVGNSGAIHVGNKIITVFSRDYESTEDDVLFAVRKWDANTGALLNSASDYMNVSANIESAGMSYNPIDGKVYGLFHVTNYQLPEEILNDSAYSVEQDDTDWNREGLDDGYLIGTIDLKTMEMTPITKGLYYGNFVAFAINSEGRAFALTSGGANGYEGQDGKIYNIDNQLGGAQPIEFDLKTGLMKRNATIINAGTDSAYVAYSYPYPATGYCSQVKRQAACFSKSNPNKLYWVGFYNSGKGINDWGSWGALSDKEWRTNGKYDTALYELDLLTGNCKRLAKVPNRMSFSCIWLEGDDITEGVDIDINAIQEVKPVTKKLGKRIYNLNGQQVEAIGRGLHIVTDGSNIRKVIMR